MTDLINQADNMDTDKLLALYNKKKELHDFDPDNEIRAKSLEAIKHVLRDRGVEVE